MNVMDNAVFDPEESICIKDQPEIRHVLSHLYFAIEALTEDHKLEALYELKSIESLIFWEDEAGQTRTCEGNDMAKHKKNCKNKRKKRKGK